MKWSGWIVFSLVTLVGVAINAVEPRPVPPRVARAAAAHARYTGEDLKVPSGATPPSAAITPHAPVHYRLASWDIWSGTSSGYVYSPGACDYTPPCVNHLWDGYVQRPHRCCGPRMHHHCHLLHGCNSCGECGMGSGCNTGCGRGGHCSLLKRAHGFHFGSCSSCCDIAPSCGFDGKGLKDIGPAPADAPPAPTPAASGEESADEAPALLPEKTTRGQRLRGFSWPDSSLQR